MAQDREKIKELLGSGLGPEVVASAVGCDISYVSQLLSEEVFASEVSSLRTVALTEHSKRDSHINSIEDRLISKLSQLVDDDAFYKPRDLVAVFNIVNKAQRRGAPVASSGATINNIVQLTLPDSVVRKFTTNRTNEVIEVEGQTMVTMPAHQLLKRLASAEAAKGIEDNGKQARYIEAAKYLPGDAKHSVDLSKL